MAELIEVKNLKKYFKTPGGQLHAVDDVSFVIPEGQTLGVVGESGCGKSTLGRVVLGLLDSTDGHIFYDGEDVTHVSPEKFHELRKNMQIIFQDPYSSLNPRMSVADIIAEPLIIYNVCKNKEELDERVKELMDTVGLDQRFINSYPHELDGGRRQRIGIARALALDPKFIVCDEPVSALDVSIQAQVINMFDELQEEMGLTYLFIAHDLLVVRHISDRIAVMYLGKMVEMADAAEIYDHPLHPYTKCLMSAVPLPDPIKARENKRIVLSGDIPSPLNAPSGCPFRTRCPYATDACAESMPEFKEVSSGHFVACHNLEKFG